MPNWCYQNLYVRGEQEDLNRFVSAVSVPPSGEELTGEPKWDLNKLVPLDPRSFVTRTSKRSDGETVTYEVFASLKDDGFDGYNHACSRWGTKWGACEVYLNQPQMDLEVGGWVLTGRFSSAWGPSDKLIQTISTQFPEMTFGISFTEESNAFAGWLVFKDGELCGEGEVDVEVPKKIEELAESEDEEDQDNYISELMDWQNEQEETALQGMISEVHEVHEGVNV